MPADPQEYNIANRFHLSALRHASRPALYVQEICYSYGTLRQHVICIASAIERQDPNPNNPVAAVFAYRSLTAYASVLAILYAGKGYVPLNPNFPVERNLHITDLAEVEILILDSQCEQPGQILLEKAEKNLVVLLPDHEDPPAWTQQLARHRFYCRRDILDPLPSVQTPKQPQQAIAYLLFTSGTTGIPKGVMVSHNNVNAFVDSMLERYQPTPDDRFSQHSDLTFDASVYDQFVCWAAGASLYSIPQNARMAPAQFIKEHGLTFWESVPAVIQFMKKMYLLKPNGFPSLRMSIFGGEQLTLQAVQLWQAAAPNTRIENTYGPTEGTICITGYFWQPGHSEAACINGSVPIGMPYAGQRAAILAADGQLLEGEEEAKGELCLNGSQITPGYWKNAAETARRYLELADEKGQQQRWYKTGDLVLWKQGTGYYYLDRVDRQVKIRGYRVELAEIEHVLRQASHTDQVAVLSWPFNSGNVTSVVGFVCGSKQSDADILHECASRLPHYMIPRSIQRLPQLPLNPNGKVDLLRLAALLPSEQPH